MALLRSPFVALAILAVVPAARAAQDAVVVVEEAEVRESPDADSQSLETVKKGMKLRISESAKDGWYQSRLPGRSGMGWIRAQDVLPDRLRDDLKSSGVITDEPKSSSSGRHRLVIAAFYDATYFTPVETSDARISHGFSAALGYRPKTDWTIRARYDANKFERDGVTVESKFASLLIEYAALHAKPWKIEFGIGPLMALSPRVTVVSSSTTDAGVGKSAYGGVAKLHGHWYFFDRVSLGIEAGYRYVLKQDVELEGSSTVEAQLSAPFAGLGLQIEL
jgi:hypothetical protein